MCFAEIGNIRTYLTLIDIFHYFLSMFQHPGEISIDIGVVRVQLTISKSRQNLINLT